MRFIALTLVLIFGVQVPSAHAFTFFSRFQPSVFRAVMMEPFWQRLETFEEPGLHRTTINSDGYDRFYNIYVPSRPIVRPAPLLVALHGGSRNGRQFSRIANFEQYAERSGAYVVYPDGLRGFWADGRGYTWPDRWKINDVKYIRTLIEHLSEHYNIDKSRVYVVGVSNGGMLAQQIACELSDVVAGVASVISAMPLPVAERCEPTHALDVLMIQGNDDGYIPFHGGTEGWLSGVGVGGTVISHWRMLNMWLRLNECNTEPAIRYLPEVYDDGTKVVERIYDQCFAGSKVASYIVEGGGHFWYPRGRYWYSNDGLPSDNIDSTDVVWKFFGL